MTAGFLRRRIGEILKRNCIMKETMLNKIKDRSLTIGVVGLGYVGLPLIVEKAKAGFKCIGFDVQQEKVDMVNAGKNYIGDVVDAELSDQGICYL